MKFTELIDIQPMIRVCDIIQLFLLGHDDKVYLNLASSNKDGYYEDYILKDERIISDKWQPYYERKVEFIEDMCEITLVIKED